MVLEATAPLCTHVVAGRVWWCWMGWYRGQCRAGFSASKIFLKSTPFLPSPPVSQARPAHPSRLLLALRAPPLPLHSLSLQPSEGDRSSALPASNLPVASCWTWSKVQTPSMGSQREMAKHPPAPLPTLRRHTGLISLPHRHRARSGLPVTAHAVPSAWSARPAELTWLGLSASSFIFGVSFLRQGAFPPFSLVCFLPSTCY